MDTEPRDDDDADLDDSSDTPPALPSDDDDSALGDTDQHSDADA
jgi:hypothetical protein